MVWRPDHRAEGHMVAAQRAGMRLAPVKETVANAAAAILWQQD